MLAILLLLALAPGPACLAEAIARAQALDLPGAAAAAEAARDECAEAPAAAWYLRGLVAARAAYAQGGSAESLRPVTDAIAALDQNGAALPGAPQIAKFVLLAAAAAAQSERDEMSVFLDEALRLEALQLAAREPGAPVIGAHEIAGDLWLQVHRFDEAQAAYERAAALIGATPRIARGLQEVAARRQQTQPRPAAPPTPRARRTPAR